MKRSILLVTLLLLALFTAAQGISVKSFRALPMDMTASSIEGKRLDQNGNVAALIKVVTSETGFAFEGGTLGIVDTKQKIGEIWVWVPYGAKKITILHQQLGVLRDYQYPIPIEAERCYEMVLIVGKVIPVVQEAVREQFLVFNVEPKDAMVTVDGVPWPVVDGVAQKMVEFGSYEYRVEASDYHTDAGKIKVNDPDNKVVVPVTLRPAFGFLKIEGDQTLLFQASIHVDNSNGSEALREPMRLGSGNHRIRIVHPKYKPYEQVVTILDGETFTKTVNLSANFSTITLKVNDDAEIFVNNESKGVRSWTGDLESGNYLFECRKEGHLASSTRKAITENMSGTTIQLDPPTPINGTLVISSNPPMANIYIDGKPMGETPLRINAILIGQHTLRLEKAGCAPLSKTFTIEEGKTLTLDEKLDTGRSVVVKTDRSGDKIYVDGDLVGESPRETPLSFGHHTIRVVRNGIKVEKEVDIQESTRNGLELCFEFGRLITISTDRQGDVVIVDGEKVGTSPVCVDLPEGKHSIHAQRDKKYADKDIVVLKMGGETAHALVLHGETVGHFVQNGVNFATLDGAYGMAPQLSFGATFGSVKRIGWFVTAASNFSFAAMQSSATAGSDGLVDGDYYYDYTGESCSTRISAMAGMVVRVAGPVYLKLGAGYGSRVKSWYTTDGSLVKISDDSFTGVDATVGILLNLKGFSLSLDAVTTNFKTVEAKVGLGYCWKRK